MLTGWPRLAALCLVAASLAGCASDNDSFTTNSAALPQEHGRNLAEDTHQAPLQCAPYAREHSAVKIYGDAWTWWDKAAGRYSEGQSPAAGAVLVLSGYAGPERAHVAVVRRIVSEREIRIDHANWLDDGSIYINDPVVDVSSANDWSQVKVWNIKTGGWGAKTYPVQGFISAPGDGAPDAPDTGGLIARADIPADGQ